MKKRVNILMPLFSAAAALAGLWMWIELFPWAKEKTFLFSVIFSILFFTSMLLLGFGGMWLAAWIGRKKYQIVPELSLQRLGAVLLVTAAVAGFGQLLYGIEPQIRATETVVDKNMKGLHLVLLMDVSGSMEEEQSVCAQAACQMIENLDETNFMQFVAFAGTVPERGESAFLPLTAENKAALQMMAQTVTLKGGTNFNEPLDKAITTLQSHQNPEYRSLIIMLTDGEDSVNSEIKSVLTDPKSGIDLFTLRITDDSGNVSGNVQELIDLAEKDFPIVQKTDGSVDLTKVQDAFREALSYRGVIVEEQTKLGFGSNLIFDTSDFSFWWQPLIQSVVFSLYSLLISIAYYGKTGLLSAGLNLAVGAAAGFSIRCDEALYVSLLLVCLSAFVILETEEVEKDV